MGRPPSPRTPSARFNIPLDARHAVTQAVLIAAHSSDVGLKSIRYALAVCRGRDHNTRCAGVFGSKCQHTLDNFSSDDGVVAGFR